MAGTSVGKGDTGTAGAGSPGSTDAGIAVDEARLRRLLGTPELAWLVDRVRRRMAREEPLTGTVSLSGASAAQRAAAELLLGRAPRPGSSLSVPLTAVDAVLRRAGIAPGGLIEAVTALTGPVVPHAETARAEADAWDRAWAPVARLAQSRPELASWYERLRASGLVRRLTAGDPATASVLLADLAAVLRDLPTDGVEPGNEPFVELGLHAARTCGDAHALDDDRPLATLALGAVRALTGHPPGSGTEWRREAWAAVGLLKDELSSTVLTLGLPGDCRSATGRALAAFREAGQPAVLTLRQLARTPSRVFPASVRVCENPVVVSAAADRLGASCPPLVCLQGQPSAAALLLLRACSGGGTRILFHGDFDWGGLRIAGRLREQLPWLPWRYTAADYLTAARAHPRTTPLTGPPAPAAWDPELAHAMTATGRRIEEELLLADLIDDLASYP
jgi:uncharacterized protein (TIGR02679 family)